MEQIKHVQVSDTDYKYLSLFAGEVTRLTFKIHFDAL